MKGTHLSYWGNIVEGITTLWAGLVLSWKHMFNVLKGKKYSIKVQSDNYFDQQEGVITVQYPNETIPVPDNGRYRLDNVIEDCIVCDKCAKVCPVNCIDIEPIRSATEIRKASDGSSVRLYAATFDIDMAKCMYCGLCTTVCPTECLTMTKTYDFSEFDVERLNYSYSDLTPEQAVEKQEEFDIVQAAKKAKKEAEAKAKSKATGGVKPVIKTGVAKPTAIKPKVGVPKIKKAEDTASSKATTLRPKIGGVGKPKIPIKKTSDIKTETSDANEESQEESHNSELKTQNSPLKPKIGGSAMKPKIPNVSKAKVENTEDGKTEKSTSALKPKIGGAKKPSAMKPKIPIKKTSDANEEGQGKSQNSELKTQHSPLKPKIGGSAMKPKIPGVSKAKVENTEDGKTEKSTSALKSKIGGAKKPSAMKPKIPIKKTSDANEESQEESQNSELKIQHSPLKPKIGGSAMKPKIPNVSKAKVENAEDGKTEKSTSALKPKIGGAKKPLAMKPKIPIKKTSDANEESQEESQNSELKTQNSPLKPKSDNE